jgi:hypothetical protein
VKENKKEKKGKKGTGKKMKRIANFSTDTLESKRKRAPIKTGAPPSSSSMPILSPEEQVLHLQRTMGNRAVTRLIRSGALQARFKSGQLIQRDNGGGASAPSEAEKAEIEFGRKLWASFPAGIAVAFYDKNEPEAVNRSKDWAARENAIASKSKTITAKNLVFGKAFPDSFDIKTTLPALGKVLASASTRAGKPKGIQPLPGTGPSRIRLLATFSHGAPGWLGIGSGITKRKVASLVKSIAPNLTQDVNVILYACSSARAPSEKEDWFKGTMKPGGAKSLGGLIRDALLKEGAKQASVWGHQTVGHMTRNFALRVFYASHGSGAAGESYAGEFVFGVIEEVIALNEVIEEITTKKGYNIEQAQMPALQAEVYKRLSGNGLGSLFYKCYSEANRKVKYRGVNLAEMAPVDPVGVSGVIENYWKKTYWPGKKSSLADALIKKFRLKKTTK